MISFPISRTLPGGIIAGHNYPATGPLMNLPGDLILHIFSFLEKDSRVMTSLLCKKTRLLLRDPFDAENVCTLAAMLGHRNIVTWAYAKGARCLIDTYHVAARGNHTQIVQDLRARQIPWDKWVVYYAVENNNLELLEWAVRSGVPFFNTTFRFPEGGGWNLSPQAVAIFRKYKSKSSLHPAWKVLWLCQKGANVAPPDLEEFLKKNLPREVNDVAAQYGRLDLIHIFRAIRIPFGHFTFYHAIKSGNNLLIECPLNDVEDAAVFSERIDILCWLRDKNRDKFWTSNLCCLTAKAGHLKMLQWLKDEGCPWDFKTCASAAREGHYKLLKWAVQAGCPLTPPPTESFDTSTVFTALAARGELNWLEWLLNNYLKEGVDGQVHEIAMGAARVGRREILEWVVQKHGYNDFNAILRGAIWTCFSSVEFALERGAVPDQKLFENVASGGSVAKMRRLYAVTPCSWTVKLCDNILNSNNPALLKWALSNGAPWSKEECLQFKRLQFANNVMRTWIEKNMPTQSRNCTVQ